MPHRPVWAEISLRKLVANYHRLQALAGAELMPVVKANAYGHGAQVCAAALTAAGARWLAVTDADEGVGVRSVCPGARIVVLSGIWPGEAEAALDHRLTPVVWEDYHLEELERAAAGRGMPPNSVAVHLEIDSGMSRQGIRLRPQAASFDLEPFAQRLRACSHLRLEGVMTHFCEPQRLSASRENPQIAILDAALATLAGFGLAPELLHAGNSSTTVAGADRERLRRLASRFGAEPLLRPGLALYGYLDRFQVEAPDSSSGLASGAAPGTSPPEPSDFQPALAWKTQISSLRSLDPGETAGYDHTFTARRRTTLALLPAGYADGLNRLLSNRGHVLIRGSRAPIAGRISMDQTVVDVTEIPGSALGDEAVLLGTQGQLAISAWDLADLAGTIPWEILCAISARVPRLTPAGEEMAPECAKAPPDAPLDAPPDRI